MRNWKTRKSNSTASRNFSRQTRSQDEFDTSKADYDALAGTVAADAAGVTNAQLTWNTAKSCAPFDGKTGSLQFHEGNVIKAQDDTLLTINRIQSHLRYVRRAERYLAEIKKEMRVKTLAARATF